MSDRGFFKSGWRPSLGWVCVAGFFYEFLVRPLLNGMGGHFPGIDGDALTALTFALLGLVGARTTEKIRGAANDQ